MVVTLLTGCLFETSDDLPFGFVADAGTEADVGTLFEPDGVPNGGTCSATALVGATCDAVLQDCGEDLFCDLAFDTVLERARAVCKPIEGLSLIAEEGDECDTSQKRCAAGYFCVSYICRRFCEIETGLGCAQDEFCAAPFNATHGVCLAECT